MKEQGISFEEKDLNKNEVFVEEFISYGGGGTPLTIIKDGDKIQKVLGFNQDKLSNFLKSL